MRKSWLGVKTGPRDHLSILIENSLLSQIIQSKTNIKHKPMLKPNQWIQRNLKRISKSMNFQTLWKSCSLNRNNWKNSWSKSHQRLNLFSPTQQPLVWIKRLPRECLELLIMVESLLYLELLMRIIRKILILEPILTYLFQISLMMETQKTISKKLSRRTKC